MIIRYTLKLRSIDMKRENGVFHDKDGLIPEGNIYFLAAFQS
jgi:hypothetical protein